MSFVVGGTQRCASGARPASHHLARYDAVELSRVLLGEVSVVDQLERDQALQPPRDHLTTPETTWKARHNKNGIENDIENAIENEKESIIENDIGKEISNTMISKTTSKTKRKT